MVNDDWYNLFPNSTAMANRLILRDHSSIIVSLGEADSFKAKSFKHFNCWCSKEGYPEVVAKSWSTMVLGFPLYILIQKTKVVKNELIAWAKKGWFAKLIEALQSTGKAEIGAK